jgi:diguanylate cyclase (GGDEF)-like protein
MKVTRAAADPESSVMDIARIIETDAALSAQVLKAVNSAIYSPRSSITTTQRAISFMGINAVRNLVLCLAARKLFVSSANFPLEFFWEGSLRRGAAARGICEALKHAGSDELFTIGLLQDIGTLVMLKEHPERGDALAETVGKQADERRDHERASWDTAHDVIGAELLKAWQLPDTFANAVLFHHEPSNAPQETRWHAKVLHCAETIADLSTADDRHAALESATSQLKALGIVEDSLGDLIERTNELVNDAAGTLEIKVGKQPTLAEIQSVATEGLLSLNLTYQDLTDQLKSSLAKQREMADELSQINQQLRELAATDPLTGLPNRRSFDEAFKRELAQAARQQKPLSVLMLDVDHFKRFNDRYGHHTGDRVLQEVARTLDGALRKCDFPARYGGEEFCALLPFTPADGAKIAAERIRQAIADMRVEQDGIDLQVTVSIGGAEIKDPSNARASVLALRSADDALYDAKEGGRNRVVVAS